jgi:leucyl-tRNA synthetase
MAPITPHLSEEIWNSFGGEFSIHSQTWPQFDENFARSEKVTIAVQISGKLRDTIDMPLGSPAEEIEKAAKQREKVQGYIEGKQIVKVITVPDRLINIVVK